MLPENSNRHSARVLTDFNSVASGMGCSSYRMKRLIIIAAIVSLGIFYPKTLEAGESQPLASQLLPGSTWTNSLGMVFRPITNCPVLFSIWETRVQDFALFVTNSSYQPESLTVSLRDGATKTRDWRNPGFAQTPDHPIVLVSWEDAQAFCDWLTKREHELKLIGPSQLYRLPTDNEWSLAVGPAIFPWAAPITSASATNSASGKGLTPATDDRLWFPPPPGAGNYAGTEIRGSEFPYRALRSYDDGYIHTAPVGSFSPNANGLFDLGGNVAEFCLDWFKQEMNSPELRPKLPFYSNDGGGQTYRVVRGASWIDSHPGLLRSDCHFFEFPDHRSDNLGFRIVLVR
jgi:formylglycine-generating enzyme required for sulfatase activity